MGWLSDRVGRRRNLIPALLLFSFMSVFTGLIGTAVALVAVRLAMGAAEGAFLSTSVAATGEASHPLRRGMNQGIQLSAFSLIGLGCGPIVATQLLKVVPSWRWVFGIVAIPGFLLAVALYRVIREPAHLEGEARAFDAVGAAAGHSTGGVLRSRNVLVAMGALVCAMSCIFVMGAMVPNYLVDFLELSSQDMGWVTSAIGWGGFAGSVLLPALSDFAGRRRTAVIAFLGALAATWLFMHAPARVGILFAELLVLAFFSMGILSLLTGPIATEAVSPAMVGTAIGLVSGAGEIVGGGLAPVIAGYIAQRDGIQYVFYEPLVGLAVGAVACLLFLETAPRRLARLRQAPGSVAPAEQ
jgi:MFS family permease